MFTREIGNGFYMERVETRHSDAFFAVISTHRERLGRWEPWPWEIRDAAACRAWIGGLRDDDARDAGIAFGVWRERELVGMAALSDLSPKQLAVTYWGFVVPKIDGSGVSDAATRVVLDYAFEEYGLERVNWYCAERNHPSRALAARLGLRYNGRLPSYQIIRDQFVDYVLYSLLAPEWRAARTTSAELPVRRAVSADQAWVDRLVGRPLEFPAWVIAEKAVLQTRRVTEGVMELATLAVVPDDRSRELAARLIDVVENRLRQQGTSLLQWRIEGQPQPRAWLEELAREYGFHPLQPDVWVKGL